LKNAQGIVDPSLYKPVFDSTQSELGAHVRLLVLPAPQFEPQRTVLGAFIGFDSSAHP